MSSSAKAAFRLSEMFVHLRDGGDASLVECTPAFWSGTASGTRRYDRLVGVFHFEQAEDLHPSLWEMHPAADELLYLVSGAVGVVLEEPPSERVVELRCGEALVVPRGVWHRLLMRVPGDLLFINSRTDMQGRPV